MIGFAESLTQLLQISDLWVDRGIGTVLVLLLLIINVAGVKWVIRLQFVLLFFLLLAAIDFLSGVFIRHDPGNNPKSLANIASCNLNFISFFTFI